MPSFTEHVRRSVERTGDEYIELNRWLDGDQVSLSQRLPRHFRLRKYSKYVQNNWGENGLTEYRRHIKDDFKLPFITVLSIIRRKLSLLTTRTVEGGEGKK
ncbi:MAG TPA: hypothetical protein VJ249_07130 [Candidatus Bathyarchaeia archaeon]|nr:hypothetical protein [Candidatus Bathyarchaeia archaeon]